jgi:hypothetical protein
MPLWKKKKEESKVQMTGEREYISTREYLPNSKLISLYSFDAENWEKVVEVAKRIYDLNAGDKILTVSARPTPKASANAREVYQMHISISRTHPKAKEIFNKAKQMLENEFNVYLKEYEQYV